MTQTYSKYVFEQEYNIVSDLNSVAKSLSLGSNNPVNCDVLLNEIKMLLHRLHIPDKNRWQYCLCGFYQEGKALKGYLVVANTEYQIFMTRRINIKFKDYKCLDNINGKMMDWSRPVFRVGTQDLKDDIGSNKICSHWRKWIDETRGGQGGDG